jgi:hypothetical protein
MTTLLPFAPCVKQGMIRIPQWTQDVQQGNDKSVARLAETAARSENRDLSHGKPAPAVDRIELRRWPAF